MNKRKKKNENIKKYIIPILTIFFIVFISISFSIFFLIYTQNLINKNIFINLSEITKQDAEKIENRIQEHIRILETIINEIQEGKAENEEQIFNIYNRNSGKEEFSRIAILYENGTTITNDGKTVDLSEDVNDFFSEENIKISQSRKSKIDNNIINIYSKKINLNNKQIVILLVIDSDKYRNLFTQNLFYGNGIECLITEEGKIIANSENEENSTNIFTELEEKNQEKNDKIEKLKTDILENRTGQVFYRIMERKYYISFEKLSIEDVVLMIIIPEDIIGKDLIQLLKTIIIVSILIVIIAFIITLYIIISNEKKKRNLYKLAYIDSVTNLGNYNYYLKEVKEKIKVSNENTIVILDIDKFKSFNKKYGHLKGNELLKRIGEEIKKCIRKTDIVCRLGNDIYGILLLGEVDIKSITERLNEKIERIKLGDKWYNIKISIGLYKTTKKEEDAQEVIDKAIIAHDYIKGKYNEKYGVFEEKLEKELSYESEVENVMEEALKNNEFEVYYQPQVSIKNNKIGGAEALVRWNRDGNIVSPDKFIPLFEKNLFIIKLDYYIFETVCKNIKEMKQELEFVPKISVNVSRESLMEKDFIQKYIKIIEKYNINPNEIEFEITERSTVNDKTNMKKILERLKEKGFEIALDDFGTGYSSLNMLEELPIDTLKIDKSFIDKIDNFYDKTNLLEIILLITQKLHLKSIAEGVEKREQKEYLKRLKCDFIQGYYYSKPLKYIEFKKYINENINNHENLEN